MIYVIRDPSIISSKPVESREDIREKPDTTSEKIRAVALKKIHEVRDASGN